MRFSRWRAAGNEYLLAERTELGEPLTPERVRAEVGEADGILEVVAAEGAEAEIVIWNQDGSTAEMSGNGTRIAARWLAERSGADDVRVRVGVREVRARMLPDGELEQELGSVQVLARERIAGLEVTVVSVGNPHAVVFGDPDDLPRAEAEAALAARTRRLAIYQRKWMRRMAGLVSVRADRSPDVVADEILALARSGQRVLAGRAG